MLEKVPSMPMQLLKFGIDPFERLSQWKFSAPFQQKVKIAGVDIFLCGLHASNPQYGEVVGSSANLDHYPQNHAWFELLERIYLVESLRRQVFSVRSPQHGNVTRQAVHNEVFPQTIANTKPDNASFQYSKSNGVALHYSWQEACRRACFELVERHLVLSSWLGLTKPKVLENTFTESVLEKFNDYYKILRVDFGSQETSCFSQKISSAGIVLLPKNLEVPMIIAFGAGTSLEESLAKAECEAMQRLGFLWGEEIPTQEPEFYPSALYHQEYFLFPGSRRKIESWLAGDHSAYCINHRKHIKILNVSFIDLSFSGSSDFRVAKAISPESIPLVFGKWRENGFDLLPEEKIVHPIA